jgi:hypothetical protein
MANCEFEEKEFETALLHQLSVENNRLWSPGQVLEKKLGYDFSLLCNDIGFWAAHKSWPAPPGVLAPQPANAPNKTLPNFALNLFVQVKRPMSRVRLTKKLKAHGIASPYWKFEIKKDQQLLLENLSSLIKADGLVCYAAPVFHTSNELYFYITAGSLVSQSTFPHADMLIGHKAWNYSKPGVIGVANIDPVAYELPSLDEQLSDLCRQRADRLESNPREELSMLASRVNEAVSNLGSTRNERVRKFRERSGRIDRVFKGEAKAHLHPFVRNYLHVLNFSLSFGLLWFPVGGDRGGHVSKETSTSRK